MQHGELRSDRGSWFVNEFFLKLVYLTTHDIFHMHSLHITDSDNLQAGDGSVVCSFGR